MSVNQYIRAEATLVYIGDYEFDGIRVLETGEYRMNQSQILLPIGVSPNWFNTLGKPKGMSPKALEKAGLSALCVPGMKVKYSKGDQGNLFDGWNVA